MKEQPLFRQTRLTGKKATLGSTKVKEVVLTS